MSTKEYLTKASNLLNEKGWTQGAMAKDINGQSVYSESPYAVCYCAAGAIFATVPPNKSRSELVNLVRDAVNARSLVEWNDLPGRTKEEVLAAFDKAITSLP